MKILVPAREGSQGVVYKNRKLLRYTLDSIPEKFMKSVYVSTNDSSIRNICEKRGVNVHNRCEENAKNTSSTKSLVEEFIADLDLQRDEDILMLYLTYPERNWEEIQDILLFYKKHKASSLLCREPVITHPYLCLQKKGNIHGTQVIPHDLYRRQDYPECFRISHYVSIFKTTEINLLNNNLYNNQTIYYDIGRQIDIDTEADLKMFYKG